MLPPQDKIPNGESDDCGESYSKKEIVPPWRIDIGKQTERCAGVCDIDQVEESRDNLPGFIKAELAQYPPFAQMIGDNNGNRN